jgi:molybdate transport repressor ModE-like protein
MGGRKPVTGPQLITLLKCYYKEGKGFRSSARQVGIHYKTAKRYIRQIEDIVRVS